MRKPCVFFCLAIVTFLAATPALAKTKRARARVATAARSCSYPEGSVFRTIFCGSPLVVQLSPNQPIEFTSVARGVRFDLLNTAVAQKIAWLAPATRAHTFFLTVPNEAGVVEGVQQMFGERTRGPDGHTARNGYEALRKWDANGDGWIDGHDPIFSRLRLWSDLDGDGVAAPAELFSLEDSHVDALSLAYEDVVVSQDAHGNLVTLPSFVQMRDGSRRPMYDLWFQGEVVEGNSAF